MRAQGSWRPTNACMMFNIDRFFREPAPPRALAHAVGASGPVTVVVPVASQLALVGLNYRLQGGSEAASCAPVPLSEGPAVCYPLPAASLGRSTCWALTRLPP